MKPPTWRALAARARRLGLKVEHGRHGASLRGDPIRVCYLNLSAWVNCRADASILRTAVAVALEQLEARR